MNVSYVSYLKERGATLVEYALLLALVAVACLASIQFLGDRAEDDMHNQAHCVSVIPGSPEAYDCGYHPTTTADILTPLVVTR